MAKMRIREYLTINIYWFSLDVFLNGLGRFIQPVLVAALVAPEVKNSALGLMRGTSLIVALIVQPLAGALSDRSTLRWGRRRPFILIGTLLDFVFLVAIGLSGDYLFLFIAILLIQISSNIAHGALQGLIPDFFSPQQRGKAVGIKQFLEVAGLILTFFVTAPFLNEAQKLFEVGKREQALVPLFVAIGIIIAFLAAGLILTLVWVKERPGEGGAKGRVSVLRELVGVDVRAHSQYFRLLAGRLCLLAGVGLSTDFAVFFFTDVIHAADPIVETAKVGATVVFLILLVSFPAGYLADRIGRKPLNLAAGPVAAVGSLGLLTVTNRTLFFVGPLAITDIMGFVALVGVAMGVFLSANWTWATDLIPREAAGKFLGLSNLANAGSGILVGFLGGPIIDVFNRVGPGLGYNAAFTLGAASFLAGTLIMLRVRETKQKLVVEPVPTC